MNFTLRKREERPEPGEFNPYLAARREWDERYGDQISRAKNWRTMAMLSGLVALLATSGMIWLSVRSHVVPFVVLVDSLSRPIASGIAEQASGNDDRLRRASIFTWVENLRLVTTDGISQRQQSIVSMPRSRTGPPRKLSSATSIEPIRRRNAPRRRPYQSR